MRTLSNPQEILGPGATAWVERSLGAGTRIVQVVRSTATTSSTIFFIQAVTSRSAIDCVLRLFTNQEWLVDEPDLAEHEAAALHTAHRVGLPVPELLAFSVDPTECGVPAVLMSRLAGHVELRPDDFDGWLTQLAEVLVAIHSIDASGFGWDYFSWVENDHLRPPTWSRAPKLWQRAIEIGLGQPPEFHPVFLHRDYHPTNVLWQDSRLNGVVDWVNACRGPAGVDLAHCRSNLVKMFGIPAAERFLEIYIRTAGAVFAYHPYWEVDSLLDSLPEPGYYPPWQEYGLGPISSERLRSRQDEWLEIVLSRF